MTIRLIIFIYSLANWGGAEHILLKVCRYLMQTGSYRITIIGLVDEKPSLENEFNACGVDTKTLGYTPSFSLPRLILASFRLRAYIRSIQPDIMMNVLFPCIIMGGIIGKLCGVPHIIGNLHGPAYFKSRTAVLLDHIVSNLYEGYIVVAEHIKEQFSKREQIPAKKMTVIPNGIEAKFLPTDFDRTAFRAQWHINKDSIVIGTIGRTYREKNHRYLVEIAAYLKPLIPNAVFLIVGDGPEYNELASRIKARGLTDMFVLTGWQTGTERFMNITDLFILPSHYEGLPCSILEAWQESVPVVGTNVPGIRDLLTDTVTGVLIPVNDGMQAAKDIAALLNDTKKIGDLITQGRTAFEHAHTVEKMGHGYHNYFQNICAHTRA